MKEFYEAAGKMVIMDAMGKGHTNKEELIQYMQSEIFKNAVLKYVEMFKEMFKEIK